MLNLNVVPDGDKYAYVLTENSGIVLAMETGFDTDVEALAEAWGRYVAGGELYDTRETSKVLDR